MHTLYASLPIVFYVAALVLGLFGVRLPGGGGDLGPLAQWVLFLALGVMSLWSAYSHAFAAELVAPLDRLAGKPLPEGDRSASGRPPPPSSVGRRVGPSCW
jgi:hypothetical protein